MVPQLGGAAVLDAAAELVVDDVATELLVADDDTEGGTPVLDAAVELLLVDEIALDVALDVSMVELDVSLDATLEVWLDVELGVPVAELNVSDAVLEILPLVAELDGRFEPQAIETASTKLAAPPELKLLNTNLNSALPPVAWKLNVDVSQIRSVGDGTVIYDCPSTRASTTIPILRRVLKLIV
jgi:hypothetical protein